MGGLRCGGPHGRLFSVAHSSQLCSSLPFQGLLTSQMCSLPSSCVFASPSSGGSWLPQVCSLTIAAVLLPPPPVLPMLSCLCLSLASLSVLLCSLYILCHGWVSLQQPDNDFLGLRQGWGSLALAGEKCRPFSLINPLQVLCIPRLHLEVIGGVMGGVAERLWLATFAGGVWSWASIPGEGKGG